jgi:hypothetical protein
MEADAEGEEEKKFNLRQRKELLSTVRSHDGWQ